MKKYANSSFRISLAEQLIYPSPGRLLSTVPWQSGTHLFPCLSIPRLNLPSGCGNV